MYVVEILWLIIRHRAPGIAQEADPSERAFAWPLGNCESIERYVSVCSSLFIAVDACIFQAPKKELWDRTTGGDAVGSSFAFSSWSYIHKARRMVL